MKIDPDLGDAWAYFYKFELAHGEEVGRLHLNDWNNYFISKKCFPCVVCAVLHHRDQAFMFIDSML